MQASGHGLKAAAVGLCAAAASFVALLGAAVPADAATFEPGPCPVTDPPTPVLQDADCGYLVVPESRSTPTGRTIRLPVAIIPAQAPNPPADPIVYMEGGPGGPGLPSAQGLVEAGINRERDLIVVGQRGSAYADPALLCPGVDGLNTRTAGLRYDAASTGRKLVRANAACYRDLVAQGIDLGAYNTTESAADFADLRTALGIAEWNVYGVSYGTDLALTYQREHPQGVRSVTVDSVVPPHRASLSVNWVNAGAGMRTIFRECRAQRPCRRHYPSFKRLFTRLVRELESDPARGRVKPVLIPGEKAPPGAKKVKTVVDGGGLATWTFGLTEVLGPDLPSLLTDFARGREHDVLASYAASKSTHAGVFSYGLQNGVVCSEWVPYERPRKVLKKGEQAFPGFPRSVRAQAPQFPFFKEICRDAWEVPKAPAAQREVTTGTIRTLVVSGGYDALTSAKLARSAAEPLSNSTFVVIPGIGHFVVPKSPCAQEVMASFIDNPSAPNTGCVAALEPPPFTINRR